MFIKLFEDPGSFTCSGRLVGRALPCYSGSKWLHGAELWWTTASRKNTFVAQVAFVSGFNSDSTWISCMGVVSHTWNRKSSMNHEYSTAFRLLNNFVLNFLVRVKDSAICYSKDGCSASDWICYQLQNSRRDDSEHMAKLWYSNFVTSVILKV